MIFIILIVFEAIEIGSWFYNRTGINIQVINALDIYYIAKEFSKLLVLAIVLLVLVIIIVYLPCPKEFLIIYYDIQSFLVPVVFASIFVFMRVFYKHFYPFESYISNFHVNSKKQNAIQQLYLSPIRIQHLNNTPMKNLLIIQIESFETQSMINPTYGEITPFLINLSKHGTFYPEIESMPYTTWTSAALMTTQCGLPQLMDDIIWKTRAQEAMTKWDRLHCIPDFLHEVGYSQYAFCINDCSIMGIKPFLKRHHYIASDCVELGEMKDTDLFTHIINNVFPKLKKLSNPFTLMVMNQDTHIPQYVDNRCMPTISSSYPTSIKSFNCIDQNLQRFLTSFKEAGLDKNTEIIIYGDHLTPGDNSIYKNQRKLFILIPSQKQYVISKHVTMYDVAPTIMSLLGFEYSPSFPYGESIYSKKEGDFPNYDDLNMIFHMFSKDMNFREAKCRETSGLCNDTFIFEN